MKDSCKRIPNEFPNETRLDARSLYGLIRVSMDRVWILGTSLISACWFLSTGCCSSIGIFAKNHCHAAQMQTKPREISQSSHSNAPAWCSPFPTCSQPYSLPTTSTIALERSQHCLAPCLWGSPTAMQSRMLLFCIMGITRSPLAHRGF